MGEAGFPDVRIVASDDLDERKIAELRARGAEIDVYGVGTRLVTGGEQAALGVVYKLSAVREGPKEDWRPVMKLSSNPAKRSIPGPGIVRRHRQDDRLVGDSIALYANDPSDLGGEQAPLLRPALRAGRLTSDYPLVLKAARERARVELNALPEGAFDHSDPAELPVELSRPLTTLRERLVESAQ